MELQRITNFDDEVRTERRWADEVRLRRITAAVNAFPQELLAVLEVRRSQAWPTECPALPGGRIEAIDKDKVMPTLASWHFLTGETVETVLEPSPYMHHRLEGLEKMRRKLPVLLLIDADVKVMPMNGSAGRLEATAAVIDWRKKRVYCQRTFVVTQPSPKELDHGTQIPQLPLIQDMQMMEFKVNVSNKLAELTREMTDGGLVLDPTW